MSPFNNPKQRNSVAFLLSFLVIFALLNAVGSFKAYKATESVSFCGQSCHALHPKFIAYSVPPHARVACVDCPLGPAPSLVWFLGESIRHCRITCDLCRPPEQPTFS